MEKLILDIDKPNSRFIIHGGIKPILDDRNIRLYLESFLHAELSGGEKILIPFEKENEEEILKALKKMLQRYGLSETPSEEIKKTMNIFYREEKNFQEFSSKAKNIRNNKFDKKEFKQFTEVLKNELKGRILYPLQLLSAYHLAFSQNACNFSVPGSGKTSIVYGAFAYLSSLPYDDPKRVDNLLIIGPLSCFGPWESEYKECFDKNPDSKRILGRISRKEKEDYFYSSSPSVITLISYQGIINLVDDVSAFLRKNKTMVVLDEAHKIKNVDGGITAQSVLTLAKYSNSRVVLTGTPLPNGFQDLYNLYKFIWPTKEIICYHLYQLKQMSQNIKDKRVDSLVDNISPFFIRIKKSDLGIPEPINHPPITIKMGKLQKEIYEYVERKYIAEIMKDNSSASFRNVLTRAKLIRLMQVATNPALLQKPLEEYYHEQGLPDGLMFDDSSIMVKIRDYASKEIPQKFVIIKDLITKILSKKGEKIVIWATFIQNILDLSEYLTKEKIQNKVIFGAIPVDLDENDTETETREKIIKEFHNPNSKFRVLIVNPFSVAESISLHKACHNAIYLERTFNAGYFIQSKDRIHRYGLKPQDIINYYYLVSATTVDEVIHDRLAFKEKRMNDIMESQIIPLFNNIDNEDFADHDIKAIIDDYINHQN